MAGNDAGTTLRLCYVGSLKYIPLLFFFFFCHAGSYVLGLQCDGHHVRMPLLALHEASICLGSNLEE